MSSADTPPSELPDRPEAGDASFKHVAVAIARPDVLVCEQCDAVHSAVHLKSDQIAHCKRCGAVLERGHRLSLDGVLALVVAGLVMLLLANSFPIVSLSLRGIRNDATLPDAIWSTWELGEHVVAVIAAGTAVAGPLCLLSLRLYVMVPLAYGIVPPWFRAAMRTMRFMSRWSMVEVFLFATLVAVVRIAGMASVIPGVGIFSFVALMLLLASVEAAGTQRIWERAAELHA
jgi:paraquat-inducible protein A